MVNHNFEALVPGAEYCVFLKKIGFPQFTYFMWVDTRVKLFGIAVKHNQYKLVTKDDLEGIPESDIYAAPTVEDFYRNMPPRYFLMGIGNGAFNLIDAMQTKATTSDDKDVKSLAVTFTKIDAASSFKAADCFARGLIYLVSKNFVKLKEKKS